jgi:hypothetical protein
VKAGAKANRRAHAANALRKRNGGPERVRTSRVAMRSAGLAAFYAGLEKALARPAAPADARIPAELWPAQAAGGGVLSRSGALALALALLALALLLGFAVVPRLAAARFLPASRLSVRLARESLVVTLGTAAVCGFLALLLIRAAL